jgi:hypothetical protein
MYKIISIILLQTITERYRHANISVLQQKTYSRPIKAFFCAYVVNYQSAGCEKRWGSVVTINGRESGDSSCDDTNTSFPSNQTLTSVFSV